ncbi:MAG: hypothetical protein ACI9NY_000357 [Kiritimatiellia bacterium]|jgi:hypothetical protein
MNLSTLKQVSLHIRALKVAAIVGSLLCLINHGDVLMEGQVNASLWLKLLLTYTVPYAVSLYSAVQALSQQKPSPS